MCPIGSIACHRKHDKSSHIRFRSDPGKFSRRFQDGRKVGPDGHIKGPADSGEGSLPDGIHGQIPPDTKTVSRAVDLFQATDLASGVQRTRP